MPEVDVDDVVIGQQRRDTHDHENHTQADSGTPTAHHITLQASRVRCLCPSSSRKRRQVIGRQQLHDRWKRRGRLALLTFQEDIAFFDQIVNEIAEDAVELPVEDDHSLLGVVIGGADVEVGRMNDGEVVVHPHHLAVECDRRQQLRDAAARLDGIEEVPIGPPGPYLHSTLDELNQGGITGREKRAAANRRLCPVDHNPDLHTARRGGDQTFGQIGRHVWKRGHEIDPVDCAPGQRDQKVRRGGSTPQQRIVVQHRNRDRPGRLGPTAGNRPSS